MYRNLLYLSVLTTIVVFSMIGFNIFHNFATTTVSQDLSEAIVPITPSFDNDTLKRLEERRPVLVDLRDTIPSKISKIDSEEPSEVLLFEQKNEKQTATSSSTLEGDNEE